MRPERYTFRSARLMAGFLVALAATFTLSGCEDAVRRPVAVHPIQISKPTVAAATPVIPQLPLNYVRGGISPFGMPVPAQVNPTSTVLEAAARAPFAIDTEDTGDARKSEPAPIDEIAAVAPS